MLSHFVARALAQNLDLAQASARVSQARAGLGAATAALLPSASINGQAGRAYQSIETPLGQVLNTTPDFDRYGNSYEANLGASWELDIFGDCAAVAKPLSPSTRPRRPEQPLRDWRSPHKPPTSTSPSADCRPGWTLRTDRSRLNRISWKSPALAQQRIGCGVSGSTDRRFARTSPGDYPRTPDRPGCRNERPGCDAGHTSGYSSHRTGSYW